jgi:hypothetical protein
LNILVNSTALSRLCGGVFGGLRQLGDYDSDSDLDIAITRAPRAFWLLEVPGESRLDGKFPSCVRWSPRTRTQPHRRLLRRRQVANLLDAPYVASVFINGAAGRYFEPGMERNILVGLSLRYE